jgi:hypothetical protein
MRLASRRQTAGEHPSLPSHPFGLLQVFFSMKNPLLRWKLNIMHKWL